MEDIMAINWDIPMENLMEERAIKSDTTYTTEGSPRGQEEVDSRGLDSNKENKFLEEEDAGTYYTFITRQRPTATGATKLNFTFADHRDNCHITYQCYPTNKARTRNSIAAYLGLTTGARAEAEASYVRTRILENGFCILSNMEYKNCSITVLVTPYTGKISEAIPKKRSKMDEEEEEEAHNDGDGYNNPYSFIQLKSEHFDLYIRQRKYWQFDTAQAAEDKLDGKALYYIPVDMLQNYVYTSQQTAQ
ncbi:hypothetical protein SK128_005718 [Halocaridina rubra]|uniref:Uncharacterized protein n=1 Tax=Halocaridina rubra TaxID=373956 RepID=A0AAN8WPP7_HALRR